MEKRDAVYYARVKPSTKKYLYDRMRKDGFSSMSEWFDEFIRKIKGRDNGKKRKRTS